MPCWYRKNTKIPGSCASCTEGASVGSTKQRIGLVGITDSLGKSRFPSVPLAKEIVNKMKESLDIHPLESIDGKLRIQGYRQTYKTHIDQLKRKMCLLDSRCSTEGG